MGSQSNVAQPPRFEVVRKVAAGGMAEIFLARALAAGLPSQVALKRVLPNLAEDVSIIGMLRDEIWLGLRCRHPNLVATLEAGESEGQPFAVLEYVDGRDLAGAHAALRSRGRRFGVDNAVHVGMQLCLGLEHLHGLKDDAGRPLNVVHRDVTPPNVLLGRDGSVKLCDLGFARFTRQETHTEPGLIKGKFSYLSPEVVRGGGVDVRADVFAVGILLWEMLTMRRLFHAPTDRETVKLVQRAEIPALTSVCAEADEVIEEIVARALAPEPKDRYASAEQLHNALAAYADWQELTPDVGALVARLEHDDDVARDPSSTQPRLG